MAFTNAYLAQKISDLIDYWSGFQTEYADWLGGSVGGGPGTDGKYPLTDWNGNESLVKCPAQLQDDVDNLVTGAQGYADAADASATAAAASAAAAAADAALAATSETNADADATAAASSATAASGSAITATTQANLATDRAGYAQEWANKAYNSLISAAAGGDEVDDYSALHWATHAASLNPGALPQLYARSDEDDTIAGVYTWTPQAAPTWAEAQFWYDSTEKALVYHNDEADIKVVIGRENMVRVRNTTGATITKGQAVYISGATGANLPNVSLARADVLATSRVLGLAAHDIENNSNGYINTLGVVEGLNTSSWSAGDVLYLDTSTAGALTSTRPTTGFAVVVGYVTISNVSVGEIKVAPGVTAQRSDVTSASQAETVTGSWTFTGNPTKIGSGAAFRILDAGNTDYADFSHDGTDFNVDFTNTNNLELNNVNEVFSTSDGGASYRGIHPRVYLQRNDSGHTLTSTTAAQKLFGNSNGALTLETGTYMFECKVRISGLSSTSGNGTFSIKGGGGATLAAQNWHWIGSDLTADTTTLFTPDMGWSNGDDTSGVGSDMVTAGTGTRLNFHAWGTFEVSSAGTIIPSIALTTAAAGTVAVGSYFKVCRLGGTGLTTLGNAS